MEPCKGLRQYTIASEAVRELYKLMRSKQDLQYNLTVRTVYNKLYNRMSIRDALASLQTFVDVSDPDINLPNIVHLYQTAEGIRSAGLPDWMQLVGLIHDLGKCIYLRGQTALGTSLDAQWGIVGDTFIVGEPLPSVLIYPEFNSLNPDSNLSIYIKHCGLDNCLVSFGHDEYMYQVLTQNPGCTIPLEGLYMIRYHSLYAWHTGGAYKHLESETDIKMKPSVKLFNSFDLYTKENKECTPEYLLELQNYYDILIKKYLPETLLF